MASSHDEYNSLRQEILGHQTNRLTILSLGLTISVTLFAAGIQFEKPFIPLIALLILFASRIQIVHAHAGIQRISSYIRVVLEEKDPGLKWESASYFIRQKSIEGASGVRNISPLLPIEILLSATGAIAIALGFYINELTPSMIFGYPSVAYVIAISVIWLVFWIYYSLTRILELENMKIDENEAHLFIEFSKKTSKKKSSRSSRH